MLILVCLTSFSKTATAQSNTQPQPIFTDSLYCMPVHYFKLVMQDLKRGDESIVKAQELQRNIVVQKDENARIRSQMNIGQEDLSLCRDSLEMKNALITNLHLQNNKLRVGKTVWTGIAATLAFLFLIK